MLGEEFKKKYHAEKKASVKQTIQQDFLLFMKKLDSIENVALIGALVKVKNLEDLAKIPISVYTKIHETTSDQEVSAEYPGGTNVLKQEIANLFYGEAVFSEAKKVTSKVVFVVERDGKISNVKAEGDNFTFNRQAEIALYCISKQFSPASINGTLVRYRFTLPITLNFE